MCGFALGTFMEEVRIFPFDKWVNEKQNTELPCQKYLSEETGLGLLSAKLQDLPELLTLFPDLSPGVNEVSCPKFSVKVFCEMKS